MFIRLRLLRNCSGSSIKWSKEILRLNQFGTEFRVSHRCCSDIKRNEELLFSSKGAGVVIPSPLRIKQTIKTGFHDLVDGFTCIQTSCPTCPSDGNQNTNAKSAEQSKADKCLFINKTTGNSIHIVQHPNDICKLINLYRSIFRWCCVLKMSAYF